MDKLIIPAPAKINLALDIKGVRTDGYHEVEMIMQSISLHDLITLYRNNGGITLEVSDPSLPTGKDNLAYRAAEMVLQEAVLDGGVDIHIQKNIPIAGGLAGGSTDAAAVLKGIQILYNFKLEETILYKMAADLGSDVPFCLHGGTAFAFGRGERLRQLPDLRKTYLVVINPGIAISTARVYRDYDDLEVEESVAIKDLTWLIESGKEIDWTEGWKNILEKATIPEQQEIREIKIILQEMGALLVLMSGSGSTVFAIVESQAEAERIKENWPRRGDYLCTAWTVKEDFSELWRNYIL